MPVPLRTGVPLAAGIDAAMASMCALSAFAPKPVESVSLANCAMFPSMLRRAFRRSSCPCKTEIRDCSVRLIRLRSARQLALTRLDFRLDRRALIVEALAQPAQRLLRCGLLRCLLHPGFAAQQLGVGTGEVEGQLHDLVGRLPIRIQDQQVARLPGRLLLDAERAIPIDGLIENLHDLVAGHDGARLRRGRGGLSRRLGGAGSEHGDARQDSYCNCCAHGTAILQSRGVTRETQSRFTASTDGFSRLPARTATRHSRGRRSRASRRVAAADSADRPARAHRCRASGAVSPARRSRSSRWCCLHPRR